MYAIRSYYDLDEAAQKGNRLPVAVIERIVEAYQGLGHAPFALEGSVHAAEGAEAEGLVSPDRSIVDANHATGLTGVGKLQPGDLVARQGRLDAVAVASHQGGEFAAGCHIV